MNTMYLTIIVLPVISHILLSNKYNIHNKNNLCIKLTEMMKLKPKDDYIVHDIV